MAACSAPPIGGPVKAANESAVDAIPSRVPTMFRSGVTAAIVDGNKHWYDALVIPYTAVKPYRPPTLSTASQQNVTTVRQNVVGTRRFNWPVLSAIKGGRMRAGTPTALMVMTREVDAV
jgi:hypothetical protein